MAECHRELYLGRNVLLYINDLETHVPLFKYVDDSTLFEICNTNEISEIQESMGDFQTWLITQVTAARGAACQFPSELPVCPGCSVYNSQAA